MNESMDLDSLHDPDWLQLVYESNSLSGSSSNQTLGSIDDCVGLQHVDLINHTFPHEDRHSSFTFTSSAEISDAYIELLQNIPSTAIPSPPTTGGVSSEQFALLLTIMTEMRQELSDVRNEIRGSDCDCDNSHAHSDTGSVKSGTKTTSPDGAESATERQQKKQENRLKKQVNRFANTRFKKKIPKTGLKTKKAKASSTEKDAFESSSNDSSKQSLSTGVMVFGVVIGVMIISMAVMYVRLRHKSASSEDTITYNDLVTETDNATPTPTTTDTDAIIDLEYWRRSQREKLDRKKETARQTDRYSAFDLDQPIAADRN